MLDGSEAFAVQVVTIPSVVMVMEDIHSSQLHHVRCGVPLRYVIPTQPAGLSPRAKRLPGRLASRLSRRHKRFALAIAVIAAIVPMAPSRISAGDPVGSAGRVVRTPVAQTQPPATLPNPSTQRFPSPQPNSHVQRLPLDTQADSVTSARVIAEPVELVQPLAGGPLGLGEFAERIDFDQLGCLQDSRSTHEAIDAEEYTATEKDAAVRRNFQPVQEPADLDSRGPEVNEANGPRQGNKLRASAAHRNGGSAPAIWNVYISNPQPAITPPPAAPPAPISIYNVPPAPRENVDPAELRRQRIAAKVSDNILGDRSASNWKTTVAPVSESLTAVQLLRDCEEKTIAADGLLKRGAAYAAREEVIESIRCYAGATDLQHGGREATAALESALNAMREAGDFLGRYGNVDSAGIARMVASHETQILKDKELQSLTPHAAADTYLDFARQNLSLAVAGNGQGARLLLLLANAERARKSDDNKIADALAITCLRAAVGSNPHDPLLASELGFLALRAGQLGEARWALQHSLDTQPSAPALQNLAETYRLAGDSQKARELIARLPNPTSTAARSMLVTTVSPSTFAQISPPVQSQGYQQGQYQQAQGRAVGNQPQQQGNRPGPQAQGFQNGPQPSLAQPLPQDAGPSVLERMANAIQSPWR